MRQYGLIGLKLGHSFSQRFFNQKFQKEGRSDCRYDLFEMSDLDELRDFVVRNVDLQGFNVTIPYKQKIMPLLDEIEPEALQVGAVNTVRVFRDERSVFLAGFNTDVEGFRLSLAGCPLPSKALVLGTGGASAAVLYVLRKLNVECRLVSRHPEGSEIAYDQVSKDLVGEAEWIVNTTPVGMYPDIDAKPLLPYEALTDNHFLYDMVYNPEETMFLKEGRLRGARAQNGLRMLHLQAEASWKIWNAPKRTVCL